MKQIAIWFILSNFPNAMRNWNSAHCNSIGTAHTFDTACLEISRQCIILLKLNIMQLLCRCCFVVVVIRH